MSDIKAFYYRAPRLTFVLPLEYTVDGITIRGHTRNISDKGITARFAEPVIRGTVGMARLRIDACSVELRAEVTHAELYDAGLRFCFASQVEQDFIETLVKLISRRQVQAQAE